MSHDVHANHFTSSEDPQPRAEDSRADVTIPPMPDRAPTGAPTLNLEKQSVETPDAKELRDMVDPDRKPSIFERLDTKAKKAAALVGIVAVSLGIGAGLMKGAEALGNQRVAEQPAGDNHAGGDILNQNQNNNAEPQYKDLENGKSSDLDHFKFIVGGQVMTREQLIHSNEIPVTELITPEEFGAKLARSWENQLNSGSNKEEADKYQNYERLPKEQATATSPRGLAGAEEIAYRPAYVEAMHLTDPKRTKPDAVTTAFRFADSILDALTKKQISDFENAYKAGTPLPHMKVNILDIKRDNLSENNNKGTASAANQIYKITFTADNGVGDTAFVESASFEFRPMSNSEGKPVWGLYQVTNERKDMMKRSQLPTPTTSPSSATMPSAKK